MSAAPTEPHPSTQSPATVPVQTATEAERTSLLVRIVIRWCRLIVLAGFLPPIGWIAGRYWWPIDLLSHFPFQAILGLSVALLAAICLRRGRLAAAVSVPLTVNLLAIASLSWPAAAVQADGPRLKICSANVHVDNMDAAPLLEWLRREKPDVLYVSELTPKYDAAVRASGLFAFAFSRSELDSPWGAALYSTRPLEEARFLPRSFGCPTMVARIDVEGTPLLIAGAHPVPPAGPRFTRLRDELLAETAGELRGRTEPVVLCGDFNATPWSYAFRDLLSVARLRDGRQGYGFKATWPQGNALLSIPIDHVLVSETIAVRDFRVGPAVRSDHFPVISEIQIARPAGGRAD